MKTTLTNITYHRRGMELSQHNASDRMTYSLGKTRSACPRDRRETAGIRSVAETRRRERLNAHTFFESRGAARR